MKQPKTFLLLGTVIGIFMLSIAYAAIQNITLTVSGTSTATPDQSNFDVRISAVGSGSAEYESQPNYALVDFKITDNTHATLNISGLKKVNDSVSRLLWVTNYSTDLNALISYNLENSNPEYFNVDIMQANWNGIEWNFSEGLDYLSAQKSGAFLISVTLKKLPISEDVSTSIKLSIVASPSHGNS